VRHRAIVLAMAAIASALISPARADVCGPLKLLTSVDLTPLPGGRMLVPVTINGASKMLLLTTAGDFTTLNAGTAKDLNLEVLNTYRSKLIDSAGNASRRYVHAQSFKIGALEGKDFPLLLTPNPDAGEVSPYDGNLSGDIMAHFDVELDFAARKMNFFSQDHCAGHVVYWPTSVVAVVPFQTAGPLPASVTQMHVGYPIIDDYHIRVPVTLDGKKFLATINTGSTRSTMDAKTAKYVFGITENSADSLPLGMVDHNPNNKIFGHVFKSLTFDGVTVTNPHIAVFPDLAGSKDPDNNVITGSRVAHIDDGLLSEVTIGLDVLRRLHIYVAFDERKLYITPATQRASEALPPQGGVSAAAIASPP
jgi:hypothetical protein